jgi:hypothetical protein
MLTPDQLDFVEKDHFQAYENSCSGSVAEMLLKLAKALPKDSTILQDADKDGTKGYNEYVDKPLAGGFTIRRIPQTKAWELPLGEIKKQIAQGAPVAVFLEGDQKAHGNPNTHGYLVEKIEVDANGVETVHLISKFSETSKGSGKGTLKKTFPVADIGKYEWSNASYAEKLPVKLGPANAGLE